MWTSYFLTFAAGVVVGVLWLAGGAFIALRGTYGKERTDQIIRQMYEWRRGRVERGASR